MGLAWRGATTWILAVAQAVGALVVFYRFEARRRRIALLVPFASLPPTLVLLRRPMPSPGPAHLPGPVVTVHPRKEIVPAVWHGLTYGLEMGDEKAVGVHVAPHGDFVTYGVGVSLPGMRDTTRARGRAPVSWASRQPDLGRVS